MADPQSAGLPAEVQSAARYTDFELHAMWPRHDTLHLIVEGDGDVQQLVGLVSNYLAGGGWDYLVRHVWFAEFPPTGLEAGEQAKWVIDQAMRPMGANEPETAVCDLCQWVGVPPHGYPCDAELLDDGSFTVRSYPPLGSSGGGAIELPESMEMTPAPAPMTTT